MADDPLYSVNILTIVTAMNSHIVLLTVSTTLQQLSINFFPVPLSVAFILVSSISSPFILFTFFNSLCDLQPILTVCLRLVMEMLLSCRSVKRSNRTGQVVVTLTTPEDGRVCIHPRSINEKETEFESPLLLYHLKLKSTSIYLHDTTMVYPLPLLFFGQGVDFFIEDGVETIAVDKSLHFKCKERTANLVKVSVSQIQC